MHKKIKLGVLILGALLLIASVIVPAVAMATSNIQIIGAADGPSFAYHFHTTGADWLAFIGVCLMIAAGIALAVKRK